MNNEMMGLDTSTPNVSSDTESGEMHTVKIDGEEMQVSVDELRNGYQRQADYTRKTQELAAERERLSQGEAIVQALESDPRSAVSALADALGLAWITKTLILMMRWKIWIQMKCACDELSLPLKNKIVL